MRASALPSTPQPLLAQRRPRPLPSSTPHTPTHPTPPHGTPRRRLSSKPELSQTAALMLYICLRVGIFKPSALNDADRNRLEQILVELLSNTQPKV